MSTKKVSIPTIPSGLDPELRRFLDAVRSYLLARDGQTGVARAEDNTLITKRELRDILPNMVGLLVQHGTRETIVKYITHTQNVYVQPWTPNFKGQPGVWIQTGLPGGDFTIWIEDGA